MSKIYFYANTNTSQQQKENSNLMLQYLGTGKDFYCEFGFIKKNKSYHQLRAFYEALNQLLPQYNKSQQDQGETEFHKDEFKFILKYVGGWYKEIKNKKGEPMPIVKSFSSISKKEMSLVLDRISKWAYSKGFVLNIDNYMRDLVE